MLFVLAGKLVGVAETILCLQKCGSVSPLPNIVRTKGSIKPAASATFLQVFSLDLVGPAAVSALDLFTMWAKHSLGSELANSDASVALPRP